MSSVVPQLPTTQQRAHQLGLSAGLLLLLTFTPLVVVLVAVDAPEQSLAHLPLLFLVAFASVRLSQIAGTAHQRLTQMSFWVFVYVFLGLVPVVQIAVGTFPWGGHYYAGQLAEAGLLILAGALAFDAGWWYANRRSPIGVPSVLRRQLVPSTVVLLALVALALAIALVMRMGGTSVLFLPRLESYSLLSDEVSTGQYLLTTHLARTPVFVLLVASVVLTRRHPVPGKRLGARWWILPIVLFVASTVLNNPIATPRYMVGTVVLSLMFVLPWKRWSNAALVTGIVLGFVLLFPFADLYRSTLDQSLSRRIAGASIVSEMARNGDFDAFQMIVNSTSAVEARGHQWGRQILGAFLFWVPRSQWPQKPVHSGEFIAEAVGLRYGNISAPLWAELNLDGGVLLVILGLFIYGAIVRTFDNWHHWSVLHGHTTVASITVPIFAGYQFFLLRGALMPALAYLAPMVLVILACSIRLNRRRRG